MGGCREEGKGFHAFHADTREATQGRGQAQPEVNGLELDVHGSGPGLHGLRPGVRGLVLGVRGFGY